MHWGQGDGVAIPKQQVEANFEASNQQGSLNSAWSRVGWLNNTIVASTCLVKILFRYFKLATITGGSTEWGTAV